MADQISATASVVLVQTQIKLARLEANATSADRLEGRSSSALQFEANATSASGAGTNATWADQLERRVTSAGSRWMIQQETLLWYLTLPPLFAGFVFILFLFACLPGGAGGPGEEKLRLNAKNLALNNIVCMLMFSIIIPDSYSVCIAVGQNEGFSGLLVGIYFGAGIIGSVAYWLLATFWPGVLWRRYSSVLHLGTALLFGGQLLYFIVAVAASQRELTRMSTLLMASRGISGVGGGVTFGIIYATAPVIAPKGHEQAVATQLTVNALASMGFGPILAEVFRALDFSPAGLPGRFSGMAGGSLGMAAATCLVAALTCTSFERPPLKLEAQEAEEAQEASGEVPDAQRSAADRWRWWLLASLFLFIFLAAFGYSSLEVASILLLETTYGWSQPYTGLAVGGTFLCCVPVKCLIDATKLTFTVFQQAQALLVVVLLSTVLLFQFGGSESTVAAVRVLLGDIGFFSCLCMAGGLMQGLTYARSFPSEAPGITLIIFLACAVARSAGPWASRYLIQVGSQNVYACSQVVVSAALAATCCVARRLDEEHANSAPGGQLLTGAARAEGASALKG